MSGRLLAWVGALLVAGFPSACGSELHSDVETVPDGTHDAETGDTGNDADAHDGGGDAGLPAQSTQLLRGRLLYELRTLNQELTDWTTDSLLLPALGVNVRAVRGRQLLAETTSATSSAGAGEFELEVPIDASDDTFIVVQAASYNEDGQLSFGVADPGFLPRENPHDLSEAMPRAQLWSWSFPLSSLEQGPDLTINLADGSAALHVFDAARRVRDQLQPTLGERAFEPLLVWLGVGSRFSCGTCTVRDSVELLGQAITHRVWLDGSSQERYWSDALTFHELGHVAMNMLAAPQRESGSHFFGKPTQPGQAFGEGWATFFSAWMRKDSRYYDKQNGALVVFDLAMRSYPAELPTWQRPNAAAGLMQPMDENEVAAMLWDLQQRLADRTIVEAMASPHMKTAPFPRGYTRRTWSDPNDLADYQDTREPHPMLADLLDALRCDAAVPEGVIDAATDPQAHLPYPSSQPLCAASAP
ncbi:MAG: hypothetical protein QM778_25770 [Myxococcales bacterium]